MLARAAVIRWTLIVLLLFGLGFILLNFISHRSRPILIDDGVPMSDHLWIISTKLPTNNKSPSNPRKTSIRRYRIPLKDKKSNDTLIRETGLGKYSILLLPGLKSLSSKTWEDIGTMKYLSNAGYRVFAVDFPKNISIDAKWLRNLIDKLQLRNLILVSPSISGPIALEYIFQLRREQRLIQGFVPIVPMGTEKFAEENFRRLRIPTWIVHGVKDVKYKSALNKLRLIPHNRLFLLKDASYRSLIDNPMEFHHRLRQFLLQISLPIDPQRTRKSF